MARLDYSLRMRCINSIPAIVVAALLNRLKPSITFVLDLMFRWSCSIKLFRYFEDRTFVSSASRPSAFISRTARAKQLPIERDRRRRLALMFDRLSEKGFGRAHVALCPEHEVHRLAGSIHCAVQINPFATNLQVGFVGTP